MKQGGKPQAVLIDLKRVANGYKISGDDDTVFVLKRNPQQSELNIENKTSEFKVNIPPPKPSQTAVKLPPLPPQPKPATTVPVATQVPAPTPAPAPIPPPLANQTALPAAKEKRESLIKAQEALNKPKQPQPILPAKVEVRPAVVAATSVAEKPRLPPVEQKIEPKPQEITNLETKFKIGLGQSRPVIIPSSAIWFDMADIHSTEHNSLPEFFRNSTNKTPEMYKVLRNKIIAIFYKTPDRYLSSSQCLKRLVS